MIEIKNLNIIFQKKILSDVTFKASKGEVTLIKGESGSGKTSLLYRVSLLSEQTDYEYILCTQRIDLKNEKQVSHIRRNYFAFTLQSSQLIEFYTVKENLEYFASFSFYNQSIDRINEVLELVNLKNDINQITKALSGGERQRLAIACALIKNTDIIILDEPTSSLDQKNEKLIFELIRKIAKKENKCIIISSHSRIANDHCDRVYEIKNTKLECVKDSDQYIVDEPFTQVANKMKFNILLKYVIAYCKIFKKNFVEMVGVLLISFILIFSTLITITKYQEKALDDILSLSRNQVYVSLNDGNKYVHESSELFQITELNEFVDVSENIYPYIYSYTEISTERVNIIPYFPENNFDGLIEENVNKLNDNGIILSHNAAMLLRRNNMTTRTLQFDLHVLGEGSNGVEDKQTSLKSDVKYILKEGVKNNYIQNDLFIYVPYHIIENIFEDNFKTTHFIGYTIFSKNFDDHNGLVEKMSNSSKYLINNDFQNSKAIESIMDSGNFIMISLIAFIVVITTIITSFMFISYFNNRKREFVLSIVSGMDYKDIIKLNVIEQILQIISALFLFALFVIGCFFFFDLRIQSILSAWMILMIEIIFMILIFMILNRIQMRKISVESVLRD